MPVCVCVCVDVLTVADGGKITDILWRVLKVSLKNMEQ